MREIGRRECQSEPIAKLQIVNSVAYPGPDGLHSRKVRAGLLWLDLAACPVCLCLENFSVLHLCKESAKPLRSSSRKQLEKVGEGDQFQLRHKKV